MLEDEKNEFIRHRVLIPGFIIVLAWGLLINPLIFRLVGLSYGVAGFQGIENILASTWLIATMRFLFSIWPITVVFLAIVAFILKRRSFFEVRDWIIIFLIAVGVIIDILTLRIIIKSLSM